MAVTTLSNALPVGGLVNMAADGLPSSGQITLYFVGVAPDGTKRSFPVVFNGSDFPTNAAAWDAFWNDFVAAQATVLDFDVGHTPTYTLYPEE